MLDLLRQWWKARRPGYDSTTPVAERWLFPGQIAQPSRAARSPKTPPQYPHQTYSQALTLTSGAFLLAAVRAGKVILHPCLIIASYSLKCRLRRGFIFSEFMKFFFSKFMPFANASWPGFYTGVDGISHRRGSGGKFRAN
jgi:hypothetical protein